MRAIITVALAVIMGITSFAVADKGAKPESKTKPSVRSSWAKPTQTQSQVQPAHQSRQTCLPPQARQPQRRESPRRDSHCNHGQRHNDHRGSFWLDLLRTPVYYAPRYPVYQAPVYLYQSPTYGGYIPQTGYGYTAAYNVPCVVETQGDKVIVNRPYAIGTQLTVLGNWVTDPNTRQPLYRRDQGTLVVEQSNGITSLCSVARGYASRGDDITIAQPAGY